MLSFFTWVRSLLSCLSGVSWPILVLFLPWRYSGFNDLRFYLNIFLKAIMTERFFTYNKKKKRRFKCGFSTLSWHTVLTMKRILIDCVFLKDVCKTFVLPILILLLQYPLDPCTTLYFIVLSVFCVVDFLKVYNVLLGFWLIFF